MHHAIFKLIFCFNVTVNFERLGCLFGVNYKCLYTLTRAISETAVEHMGNVVRKVLPNRWMTLAPPTSIISGSSIISCTQHSGEIGYSLIYETGFLLSVYPSACLLEIIMVIQWDQYFLIQSIFLQYKKHPITSSVSAFWVMMLFKMPYGKQIINHSKLVHWF